MSDLQHAPIETEEETEELSVDEVRQAWAEAAREVLLKTARSYGSLITYQKLADAVQERTGLTTEQQMRHWLPDVLRRVSDECADRGEPLISALCIDSKGSVGDGYTVAVQAVRSGDIDHPDDHAARERLACYERFGAKMPNSGGVATLSPQVAAARTRARKKAAEERVIPICPNCLIAVPASGICDNCA